MLEELIRKSLRNRGLVILLTLLMAALGINSALNLPIDAVPDMTNTQVQVVTKTGGLSPLEVERYVTFPVETGMSGMPRVSEIRSVSQLGISSVTVVFEDGTDIYRARQLITERLVDVGSRIPPGYGTPELGPLTTALGEILQFEVRGEGYSAMDLRTILEWRIVPLMRQVPGVTEVNSHGGFYKSFEIRPNPDQLNTLQIGLEEIFEAVERNNSTTGGGYIVHHGEQRFIRGQSLLENLEDIRNVVVREQPNDVPVLIRDLAEVNVAPLVRQGAVTRDGRGEIVTGMVMMLLGENSRRVVEAVKQKLHDIQATLPSGVRIEILYDRADLISRTLKTVLRNLQEGGALVIIVLLIILGNMRAGLIVAAAIPLSMLFATNIMYATGITASLMSLGAIDFGLIVDSSVIMIENCMRHLGHKPPGSHVSHLETIEEASIEVRMPTMFGELIIAIVYLPILALQGTEGKLFRPMALTVLCALAGSMILSMTLMPVLASLFLPKEIEEKDVWIVRMVKRLYMPIVRRTIRHPLITLLIAAMVLGISIPIASRLGGEFMPRLEEGDLLIEVNRLPSATLEDSLALTTTIETLLNKAPEVKTVFCKTGRPEIANDIMGVQQTDVWVILKPVEQWPHMKSRDELFEEFSKTLTENVPGAVFGFTQPIAMRVDELVAGVKAEVAVLLYGDDFEILASKSKEIENLLKSIPGAADVKADYQANLTSVKIQVRPEQLARHGISGDQVMHAVEALAGREVGLVFEREARFPILVRIPQNWREEVSLIERLPISSTKGGRPIPLGELAQISLEESPPSIQHEGNRRRTYVQCNVRGRDVAGFVQEAQQRVARDVKLPSGYLLKWGGDFEHLQTAATRLMLITPLALILVAMLLQTSLGSVRLALLIFLAIPMAASGGVFALALRGMPFSISAGVGFIALFGVAVLNGLVWVSAAENLRVTGMPTRQSALETAEVRLRPVLMTALVASLGFVPMALSTTAGSELQRPLASVVIGGLITSTLLTCLVVPAIYPWFAPSCESETPASVPHEISYSER